MSITEFYVRKTWLQIQLWFWAKVLNVMKKHHWFIPVGKWLERNL